jgi:6-phosphofructokinase 1
MGRDSGWLTLYSGLSSGSDIILIPETPFDLQKDVVQVLKDRANAGYKYHIIACSEGAYPTDESLERDFKTISKDAIKNLPKDVFGNPLLTKLNMAKTIKKELDLREDLEKYFNDRDANFELRSVVLGHTMRAGTPNVFDRVLGLRYGWHAMDYIIKGMYGKMTALRGTEIKPVDLLEGSKKKLIDTNSDLVELRNALTAVRHLSKEKLFK